MGYLKNTAGQYYYFALTNKTDGSAITSGTVNGYRTLDGGTQGAVTGTITHKGNGQWQLALSQADSNGDEIGLLFTHTSAVAHSITIVTESGTTAQDVWEYVIEGGKTAEALIRIIVAEAVGKSTGGGGNPKQFFGLDGTTVRVTGTSDAKGNRSDITLNGS